MSSEFYEWKNISHYTPTSWLGVLYLGIITGGLGYVLFFKGLKYMEASRGINAFYFKPVIATLLCCYFNMPIRLQQPAKTFADVHPFASSF